MGKTHPAAIGSDQLYLVRQFGQPVDHATKLAEGPVRTAMNAETGTMARPGAIGPPSYISLMVATGYFPAFFFLTLANKVPTVA
jgi:hypothetical protein